MSQTIALSGQVNFPAMSATAVLQVRPGNDAVAEPSPTLKWLETWNPVRWSKDDHSRFAALARSLLDLIRLISWFINLRS